MTSIDRIERDLIEKATYLADNLAKDPPRDKAGQLCPPFFVSELAIRLLLARLVNAPVEVFERARDQHRQAAHGGEDGGDDCGPCGYIEAALYEARNPGRQLSEDFLGKVAR